MTFIKQLLLSSSLIYIATVATIISIDETSESAQSSTLIDKFLTRLLHSPYII